MIPDLSAAAELGTAPARDRAANPPVTKGRLFKKHIYVLFHQESAFRGKAAETQGDETTVAPHPLCFATTRNTSARLILYLRFFVRRLGRRTVQESAEDPVGR